MKRVLSAALACLLLFQAGVSAKYWKSKDTYYKFDFTSNLRPEILNVSGEWKTGRAEEKDIFLCDFESGSEGFVPSSGVWSVEKGAYVQTEADPAKVARSLFFKNYKDFSLSFDLLPLSDENTVMIFFGYKNEQSLNSIEINSYQSKLILNGEEFVGEGSILKDEKYKIKLELNDGNLMLYCNSQLIYQKKGIPESEGRIGIGSWNSKMSFDNVEIYEITELGSCDVLIGEKDKNALAVFPELSADDFEITVPAAAKNINAGDIGIGVRLNGDEDGYYAGFNKNSLYISKKSKGRSERLKESDFKPQSGKIYEIGVVCDKDKIVLLIDGKEMLTAYDSEYQYGMCGFFSKSTQAYFKNVNMSLLEKVYPPLISDGNTVYYIDSENGRDENDGKTPETAWKTLDRPAQCVFAAGDRLLLKRGGKYEGTLRLENIAAKTDSPFVLSSYGEGVNPIITACGTAVEISNCQNISIDEVDISLRHFGTEDSIWIEKGYGIYLNESININFSNCEFKGPGAETNTIAVETVTDKTFDELSVENVTYSEFGTDGICIGGQPAEKTPEDSALKKHWAYDYLRNLKRNNVISEYRPDDLVTRAEFSTMLIAALGLSESEYRGIFKDVSSDMWYAKKIQTISDYRILPVEMTGAGFAKPDEALKREEAAAMAVLAAGKEADGDYEYKDYDECSVWTVRYIKTAGILNLMSGKGDGKFYPQDSVTRAEAAVILTKLMELMKGEA